MAEGIMGKDASESAQTKPAASKPPVESFVIRYRVHKRDTRQVIPAGYLAYYILFVLHVLEK